MNASNVGPDIIGGEPPYGFQLEVRAHGFPLTDAIRQYAVDHVAAKLAKHARAIQAVIIRCEDVNGPKGGPDKCCRIEALLRRANPVVTEEIDTDLRAAMDRAADRCEVAVARLVERRRALPRQRGHKQVRNGKTIH
jgi:putative sigma-54 modulation protein